MNRLHLRSQQNILKGKGPVSPLIAQKQAFAEQHREARGFPGRANGKESTCQCRTQEMRVQSLGKEDPLEEGMATHSSVLAGESLRTEEPSGLQPTVSQRVGHD